MRALDVISYVSRRPAALVGPHDPIICNADRREGFALPCICAYNAHNTVESPK